MVTKAIYLSQVLVTAAVVHPSATPDSSESEVMVAPGFEENKIF